MKIAVLTSIFNSHQAQPLHTPAQNFSGVDYFAFVDSPHPCDGWEQIVSPSFSLDDKYRGRRDAKIYKIMPHLFLPDYDYWIWTDPTHEVIMDPTLICEELGDKDIGLFKHTQRTCAYQEAEEVSRLGYDHQDLLGSQIKAYKELSFPENYGLYELPVSVRKNTPRTQAMNMRWWEQICKYSSRDQISLPFVLWTFGMSPHIYSGLANGGLYKNKYIPQVRYKYV